MRSGLPLLDNGVSKLAVSGCAIELVSREGLNDIFDVVGLLLAELGAVLDDDLVAGGAVVEFVVTNFVLWVWI